MNNPLVIIVGPTASGKTKLAVALADFFNGEIISADSRQVFKNMDIGTGKDLSEYRVNERQIPYHLIDILEPGERYHVAAFSEDFYKALSKINAVNHLPIVCGGTGMYIHTLLQNHELTNVPVNDILRQELLKFSKEELLRRLYQYSSDLRTNVDESTNKRLIRAIEIAEYLSHHEIPIIEKAQFNPIVIGLNPPVELRRDKILKRIDERLENGLIEEVKRLIEMGIGKEMLVFYGLEYKLTVNYLDGEFSFDIYKKRLGTAICQYAKRQMTFFRKMEKDGVEINWITAGQTFQELFDQSKSLIHNYLSA